MTVEQTKELIKLKTELLKFYFVLFIGLGTGIASLMAGDNSARDRKIFLVLGFLAVCITVFLIARLQQRIVQLIKSL